MVHLLRDETRPHVIENDRSALVLWSSIRTKRFDRGSMCGMVHAHANSLDLHSMCPDHRVSCRSASYGLAVSHPSRFDGPLITSVAEYAGSATVRIRATQLGTGYSMRQQKRIVDEWCELFTTEPTPITHLGFCSRTPKRLFASLAGQTQLTALGIKWGDYEDLAPVGAMPELRELFLGGASNVRTLRPLAGLTRLRSLVIEDVGYVSDLSPLAGLTSLRHLEVGGSWMGSRRANLESVAFLRNLPSLERLVLQTITVDDMDYSPLLSLTNLTEIRIARVRGMRPSHDELSALIPALQPLTT